MKSFSKAISLAAVLLASALAATPSSAQTQVGPVAITKLGTGWAEDAVGLSTAEPIANPAGCPSATAYRAIATTGGYKTFLAAALTAVSSGQKVIITVHNSQCVEGWPLIIGLDITP